MAVLSSEFNCFSSFVILSGKDGTILLENLISGTARQQSITIYVFDFVFSKHPTTGSA
jgi:hypothetical protein